MAAAQSHRVPAPGEGIPPADAGAAALLEVPDVDLVAGIPGFGFAGSCRPAGGYNGYTWFHLPDKNGMPPCPRREDASLAIFAARMAFSSFDTRSPLR